MKKLVLLMLLGLTVMSCTKQDLQPNYPTMVYDQDFSIGRYNYQGKSGMGMLFRCESENPLVEQLVRKDVIIVRIDKIDFVLVRIADYGYDIVQPTTIPQFISKREYTFKLQ